MFTRPVRLEDRAAWQKMRVALWPDDDDLETSITGYFITPDPDVVTLMAFNGDEQPVGFAEVGTRAYAEGCDSSPVAFLEGWYVIPAARGTGAGRALAAAAEDWARAKGLTELGSDTQLHNEAAISAHKALGFEETERLVCFLKRL
jgi:aminoglycoside 6'-N-acetyltransferase I